LIFVSGLDCRDFDGFFVVTVAVVFVSSILWEGFPPLSTSMLDMVLFMSSGLAFGLKIKIVFNQNTGKAIPHA
jgi:hypothetical protein